MVTHSLTMLEKQLVFTAGAGDSPPRNYATTRVKKRSVKSEDPMSHRIIEKRRRDRMNNCLADLSRLIPPEYLKKGRGRIEKTEIIEMAIKHIGHLQNVITSTRFNENSNGSVPSPPAAFPPARDPPTSVPVNQPLTVKHYRMGYLECMSEAMHFLVEVQGYFAGDSLCVQMINHLRKHCDKILKGTALNFSKSHVGEPARSDSSTSPIHGNYVMSPPLGMSNSIGSPSDDNQSNQALEMRPGDGYGSPKRYPDLSYGGKGCYVRYPESDGLDTESRSDCDPNHNVPGNYRNGDAIKEDPKGYYETVGGPCQRPYQAFGPYGENGNFENVPLKEENGPSQLRDMLTSPTPLAPQANGPVNRPVPESRGNSSPSSNASGFETGPRGPGTVVCQSRGVKGTGDTSDRTEPGSEFQDGDNHHMMYKFKNNIKQRFSKEKRESEECDSGSEPAKKQRPEDLPGIRCRDPLMKERLNLLDRTDPDEDKVFKFNAEPETKRRIRYGSESEIQDGDISNRLNFGHRTSDKAKKWEDPGGLGIHLQNGQRLWALSPNPVLPYNGGPAGVGCKGAAPPGPGRHVPEFPSPMHSSFNNLSISPGDMGHGIPIFALHAKGSFYIPLTLDQATLAPFLAILGIAKKDEGPDEKTVLHPVTISVNFQSHLIR